MTVVLGHLMWVLPGDYGLLKPFIDHFDGPAAVDCFFIISGFLIFRAFWRSRRHFDYWSNRVRRIYPALVAIVMMTVVLGAFITTVSLREYFGPATLRYILFNLLFMSFKQNTLPGLFSNNEVNYVNASLWTLKIEVMFYASVPIIAFFARKVVRFEILACAIYVLSVLFKMVLHHLAVTRHVQVYENWSYQLPGQLSFFLAGGLLEYCLEGFRRHARIYLALAVLGLTLSMQLELYALYPASLAIVVIYMCDVFPYLGNVSKYGDFLLRSLRLSFPYHTIVCRSRAACRTSRSESGHSFVVMSPLRLPVMAPSREMVAEAEEALISPVVSQGSSMAKPIQADLS